MGGSSITETSGASVLLDPLADGTNEFAERGQRNELTGREQVPMRRHPIPWSSHVLGMGGQFGIGSPFRLRQAGYPVLLLVRRQVDPAARGLRHDRHELGVHSFCSTLDADMFERDRCFAYHAPGPLSADRPLRYASAWSIDPERDGLGHTVDYWDGPCLAPLRLTQLERADERHPSAAGRVRAGDRPGPEPGDHRCVAAATLLGYAHLRVEVADTALGLVAHPRAVGTHVGGEAGSALPCARAADAAAGVGMDRRLVGELGGNLDERLGDKNCDRVEIGGIGGEPESLGLERDRAAAAERVEDGRRVAARGATNSARASSSTSSFAVFSHFTRRSMIPNSLVRSSSTAFGVGKRAGSEDGSSTKLAKRMARQAASGRRAHHR